MKNMKKSYAYNAGNIRCSVALFFAVIFIISGSSHAYGQCANDSLNISTGYNPNTGTLVTYGSPDPKWTSTLSPAAAAQVAGAGLTAGCYNEFNGVWTATANSNYITGQNDWGYNTTGTGGNIFFMTLSRSFTLCGPDSIMFRIKQMFTDDWVSEIDIDGHVVYSTMATPCNFQSFPAGDHALGLLSSGAHILKFTIYNCNNGNYKNATGMSLWSELYSLTNSASLIQESDSCSGYVCHDCDDSCYWKLTGNFISSSRNKFGTLTNDDVNIITDHTQMGIFTKTGLFGLHTNSTTDPTTAYLHVNCAGHNASPLSDIRFENLETNPKGNVMIIDPQTGYVYNSGKALSSTTVGVTNNSTTINQVSKTIDVSGNLGSSQIYDDGTSVGINTTGSFAYTSPRGLTGGTLPSTSGTMALDVNGVTRALTYIAISDEKSETNISDIKDPFKVINGLAGKTYTWSSDVKTKMHADAGVQYGFIAQDVQTALPEAVTVDANGNYGINYNSFIPLLTEGEKQLYTMYQQEKDKNTTMQKQIDDLSAKVTELANCCSNNATGTSTDNISTNNILYQNIPNPFNGKTEIGYFIVKVTNSASIIVCDMNGKQLVKLPVSAAGKGSVTFDGSSLTAGIYLYSLVIDGNVIDTKKMVLQ